MLQRLPIALAHVKAGNTPEVKSIQQKSIQRSIQHYNEFNKVTRQKGYYIYEF